jgi:uncharacterized protein YjgD (DUF1641 family)
MAKPVEFVPVPRDPREEVKQRIENAPVEHAAAVLSAYELLESLHTSGALDLLRGALGARGEIVSQGASLAAQPESIRTMRNLLVLGKLVGSINPDLLHRISEALPDPAQPSQRKDPPSLFELYRQFNSPEIRRALSAAADVLESVGRGLDPGK